MRLSLRGTFTASHRSWSPSALPRRQRWPLLIVRTDHGVRTLVNKATRSGLVEVQSVLLRRRIFTWKKIFTTVLTTGLVFSSGFLAFSFLYYPLDSDDDDDDDFEEETADISVWTTEEGGGNQQDQRGDGDSGTHREDTEAISAPDVSAADASNEAAESDADYIPEEQPEDAWFIPLGRFELLPQTYYRAEDPEWQALIKFNHDRARLEDVKKELISSLLTALISSQSRGAILGDNPVCTMHWLYEDYPPGPPREWQQYGLELGPDYIALLYRTRRDVDVARTIEAIWPTKVASSALGAFRTIFDGHYNKFKQAWASTAPEKKSPHPLGIPISIQAAGSSMVPTSDSLAAGSVSNAGPVVSPTKPSVDQDRLEGVGLLPFLPNYPPRSQEITDGIKQFKRDLARKWRTMAEVPKGSVLLRGTVQYSGSKGFCIMEVVAWYSVIDNRIVRVNAAIRQMKPYKQKRDPNR